MATVLTMQATLSANALRPQKGPKTNARWFGFGWAVGKLRRSLTFNTKVVQRLLRTKAVSCLKQPNKGKAPQW